MLLSQIERRLKEFQGSQAVKEPQAVALKKPKKPSTFRVPPPSKEVSPVEVVALAPVESLVEVVEPLDLAVQTPPALTDSGVFDLEPVVETIDITKFLAKYAMTAEDKKLPSKKMGVSVPLDLHARMNAFIKANQDDPNVPKSLVDLATMCIRHTLEQLENGKK